MMRLAFPSTAWPLGPRIAQKVRGESSLVLVVALEVTRVVGLHDQDRDISATINYPSWFNVSLSPNSQIGDLTDFPV